MAANGPKIGFSLSSEEHGPSDLVRFGSAAREHGFDDIIVSDHFHPWVEAQGESPFVWSVLGGLATAAPGARLGTGVTCPMIRTHPAIVAQAAATVALMTKGRFFLGVGTGEALNEVILGDRWPSADERLEMLEEAIAVMRELWTGEKVSHEGKHYVVRNARLYSCPDQPVPVYVSGFGPKSVELAARIADGFVNTSPDRELVERYRRAGGSGPAVAAMKVCWGPSEAQARKEVHRLWPNVGLPGEMGQTLPTPTHFEQAAELVTEEHVSSIAAGPDPEVHAASVREFAEAGFDEIYVHQIGADQEAFLKAYRDEVLPRL